MTETREIKTLQFGDLRIGREHVFEFPEGLLGFEDLHEFVLISEEETVPFKWLISMENPDIGFPLLSPWHLDLTYKPGGEFELERNVAMVIVTLEDEEGLMTANMRAPIIFDVKDQVGKQVILTAEKYSPTHLITKRKK